MFIALSSALNYISQDHTIAVEMQRLFLSLFCFYYII